LVVRLLREAGDRSEHFETGSTTATRGWVEFFGREES
jgi:hypothetical protein